MKRYISSILIVLISLVSIAAYSQLIIEGAKTEGYNLYSKWQSLNDGNLVIEFDTSGNFITYRDQEEFIRFQFQIDSVKNGVFNISHVIDEFDQKPGISTIQIVNDNRIRVYHWKHGNVLGIADEYYRTEDLTSFRKLIKRVMKDSR
jgi:hypothetical protein